jgi:hypothetical protein
MSRVKGRASVAKYKAPVLTGASRGLSPPSRRRPKGQLLLPPAATRRGETEQRSAEQRERAGLGGRHNGRWVVANDIEGGQLNP